MPKTNIQTLERMVRYSHLLTPDRKELLLKQLSTLSPEIQEKLMNILNGEQEFLTEFADLTVSCAIERGDAEMLNRLDLFFETTGKKLRKAEEGAERSGEEAQFEQFFDDKNS